MSKGGIAAGEGRAEIFQQELGASLRLLDISRPLTGPLGGVWGASTGLLGSSRGQTSGSDPAVGQLAKDVAERV